MTTLTETPAGEPTIVMTRVYDAPRNLVWQRSLMPNMCAVVGRSRFHEPGL